MDSAEGRAGGAAVGLLLAALAPAFVACGPRDGGTAGLDVALATHPAQVELYDYVELVLLVDPVATGRNPFTETSVEAVFERVGGDPIRAEGFCDSPDGSVYRLRFMPRTAGRYSYSLTFSRGDFERSVDGTLDAVDGNRRGLLRVDPEHPWHLVWEGTGEHYFYNGATAYWLMGWESEDVIRGVIDRLRSKRVNRVRVLLYGRHHDFPWGFESVRSSDEFKLYLGPWVARRPDSVEHPGFDRTRFDPAYWRKFERMLRYARERDITISVIFYASHPAGGYHRASLPCKARSADELRYFRYAAARLSAFSNVTWDLGNEHDMYRTAGAWPEWIAARLESWDPYDHLMSVHNWAESYLGAAWPDFLLEQAWDGYMDVNLYDHMLKLRRLRAAAGPPIPVVNEEYGYEWVSERHTPDSRRRMAWEIYMAGCYQTTGETERRGVGVPPDTGGGWVNGRGDATMTMLDGYAHIVDFFTGIEWWKLEPRSDLAGDGALCLAAPGQMYVVYLPGPRVSHDSHRKSASRTTLRLEPGTYGASWYDPRSGERFPLPLVVGDGTRVDGTTWTSPESPDDGDWVLLLERE